MPAFLEVGEVRRAEARHRGAAVQAASEEARSFVGPQVERRDRVLRQLVGSVQDAYLRAGAVNHPVVRGRAGVAGHIRRLDRQRVFAGRDVRQRHPTVRAADRLCRRSCMTSSP